MQGSGIMEHGRVNAGGKPVQGDEADDGQGYTQHKYGRLAAGACDLADNEMSMQKSVGHNGVFRRRALFYLDEFR